MRQWFITSVIVLLLPVSFCLVSAQEQVTDLTTPSEEVEGLDLQAVSELFKESENLEEFEKSLNDPEVGINNLDLDENGEVDFIRVVEEVTDDVHVIILQASLGEDEFQDVATIEVEKTDEDYSMQVQGNEELYGADYYVMPTDVRIRTWPIITWIYRPVYRPYRSKYRFGFYPRWWRSRRPVARRVYIIRAGRYSRRAAFKFTRIGRVTRVKYRPRSSTLVKRKVVRTPSGKRVITKTTKKPGKKPVVKKRVVKKKKQ
jgi:hypothetical protein